MPASETIQKFRGRLNVVIKKALEAGVPPDELAAEIRKAARAEHGDDWANVLVAAYPESFSPLEKALIRGEQTKAAVIGGGEDKNYRNLPPSGTHGAAHLFTPVEKPTAKSRKQRDEEARDAQIIENMRSIRARSNYGGES